MEWMDIDVGSRSHRPTHRPPNGYLAINGRKMLEEEKVLALLHRGTGPGGGKGANQPIQYQLLLPPPTPAAAPAPSRRGKGPGSDLGLSFISV